MSTKVVEPCIFYFTDWKGTKKQKKKRGFSRKKDALEYEREFLDKLSSSPDIAFSGMVELYLADKKMHTKLKTYKTKKSRILTWILPYFNDKAINAITAADIRQWQGALKEAVGDKILKVIIETCYLTDEEKKIACELAVKAGTDYVKTATGFGA